MHISFILESKYPAFSLFFINTKYNLNLLTSETESKIYFWMMKQKILYFPSGWVAVEKLLLIMYFQQSIRNDYKNCNIIFVNFSCEPHHNKSITIQKIGKVQSRFRTYVVIDVVKTKSIENSKILTKI